MRRHAVHVCTLFCVLLVVLFFDCALAAGQQSIKLWSDPTTGMEFVWVPAGSFTMGCHGKIRGSYGSSSCPSGSFPQHKVAVNGFWLGRYEVTQSQWAKIMGTTRAIKNNEGKLPVSRVSWVAVKKYIHLLNASGGAKFRLPTEAEWEYAARGGENGNQPSPDKLERIAVANAINMFDDEGYSSVGSKKANAFGLCDMLGNVSEWCEDAYNSNAYYERGVNSTVNNPFVSLSSKNDPIRHRVVRGGSYLSDLEMVTYVYRNHHHEEDDYHSDTGFRLVRITD